MDPLSRYIRLAFATFCIRVYSAVFDNAFVYDDKFTTKRAHCYSNITKEFEDVDNQLVDFILRNINDDNDYLLAEEKPNLKGVRRLKLTVYHLITYKKGTFHVVCSCFSGRSIFEAIGVFKLHQA
ncbi:MAG: hypothetical protein EXX96DRAFT_592921 [Benjaminiella poitrasii]|nr:MAG: hypothetical protein EXX96DRAFT_592921 [Benjaminiella poitrasii]